MSHVAWISIGFPWTNKSAKSNTKVSVTQPDRSVDFKSEVPDQNSNRNYVQNSGKILMPSANQNNKIPGKILIRGHFLPPIYRLPSLLNST